MFSTAALILTVFANTRCNFFAVSNSQLQFPYGYTPTSFGLWCYTDEDGDLWDTSGWQGDARFHQARVFGTTTTALGFVVWLFYICAACCRFPPTIFKIVSFFAFCTTIFQGLVFLLKQSAICSVSCDLDTGAKCAISACVLWFVTTLLSCAAGKTADADDRGDDGDGEAGGGDEE